MRKYKEIASRAFVKMFGEQWVRENAEKLCSSMQDNGRDVKVIFYISSMLPTEDEIISQKDPNYQPDGSISFIVNKKDLSCKVHRNLFYIENIKN